MEDEARFPFDIKNFQKAVDSMSKSVSTIQSKMEGFGKTMTQSVSKAIVGATAKIGLLVKSFKSIMGNMPEIGQSFKIAGDILSREFFFPIRQKLMPYLQKMLDWVRDHRALFAKWGQAVADTLNIVIVVAKNLWSIFKDLTTMITDTLQRALGTAFKNLDEFVAVLQVKVAFAMLLMGEAIKKLADLIAPTFEMIIEKGAQILSFFGDLLGSWLSLNKEGYSLGTILESVVGVIDKLLGFSLDNLITFFNEMKPALENLMTPLGYLVDSIKVLIDRLTSLDASPVMKFVAQLGTALLDVGADLATILGMITRLVAGEKWSDIEASTPETAGEKRRQQLLEKRKNGEVGEKKPLFDIRFPWEKDKIDDGIVTKDGKVIHLNPDDNIYAFKGAPSGGNNVSVEMSMVFNVQATEGNARAVGVELGQSIHDSFADRLKKQMMARGY